MTTLDNNHNNTQSTPGGDSSSDTNLIVTFTVVEFKVCGSIDFVPTKWISLDRSQCKFPDPLPKGFKAIQGNANSDYDPIWPVWDIECLKTYGKLC